MWKLGQLSGLYFPHAHTHMHIHNVLPLFVLVFRLVCSTSLCSTAVCFGCATDELHTYVFMWLGSYAFVGIYVCACVFFSSATTCLLTPIVAATLWNFHLSVSLLQRLSSSGWWWPLVCLVVVVVEQLLSIYSRVQFKCLAMYLFWFVWVMWTGSKIISWVQQQQQHW